MVSAIQDYWFLSIPIVVFAVGITINIISLFDGKFRLTVVFSFIMKATAVTGACLIPQAGLSGNNLALVYLVVCFIPAAIVVHLDTMQTAYYYRTKQAIE